MSKNQTTIDKSKGTRNKRFKTGRFSAEEKEELAAIVSVANDPLGRELLVKDFVKNNNRSKAQTEAWVAKIQASRSEVQPRLAGEGITHEPKTTKVPKDPENVRFIEVDIKRMSIENNKLRIEF